MQADSKNIYWSDLINCLTGQQTHSNLLLPPGFSKHHYALAGNIKNQLDNINVAAKPNDIPLFCPLHPAYLYQLKWGGFLSIHFQKGYASISEYLKSHCSSHSIFFLLTDYFFTWLWSIFPKITSEYCIKKLESVWYQGVILNFILDLHVNSNHHLQNSNQLHWN